MHHSHTPIRLIVFLGTAVLSLLLVACNGGEDPFPTATGSGGSSTASPTSPTSSASPSATAPSATPDTPSPTVTPEPTATQSPSESLRSLLLSVITTAETAADQAALEQMEVIAVPLETADRDLWAAVTSGPGVWELDATARHVAAIYERREAGSWVEVAVLPLESEPTYADIQVVPAPAAEGASWLAVYGSTGAHAGTFELVHYNGVTLSSALWWFSPSPTAATVADLDEDGYAEIVLNATDPYVYCYACDVRAWSEIIYRWVDGEPVAVNIGIIESAGQRVHDLTEQAARYVEADLWRRARSTMQLALDAAPDDEDVWWLALTIGRTADARLQEAGADAQPLTTAVLAGEYGLAVDLMSDLRPVEVYDADGPLLAGTVAQESPDVMGAYLVDYATRALEVEPTLDEAYAVRSLGRLLVDPEDLAGALMDMDTALSIDPADRFYQQARAFLLAGAGN